MATAKELGLTRVKKYWKRAGQFEMELDCLHDLILAPVTFLKYSQKLYNNQEVGQNMSIRQDIDTK